MGLGVREGFLEEVRLDSEYILLREEGQRDIPIRRRRGKQRKGDGRQAGVLELHGAQWTRRRVPGEM